MKQCKDTSLVNIIVGQQLQQQQTRTHHPIHLISNQELQFEVKWSSSGWPSGFTVINCAFLFKRETRLHLLSFFSMLFLFSEINDTTDYIQITLECNGCWEDLDSELRWGWRKVSVSCLRGVNVRRTVNQLEKTLNVKITTKSLLFFKRHSLLSGFPWLLWCGYNGKVLWVFYDAKARKRGDQKQMEIKHESKDKGSFKRQAMIMKKVNSWCDQPNQRNTNTRTKKTQAIYLIRSLMSCCWEEESSTTQHTKRR